MKNSLEHSFNFRTRIPPPLVPKSAANLLNPDWPQYPTPATHYSFSSNKTRLFFLSARKARRHTSFLFFFPRIWSKVSRPPRAFCRSVRDFRVHSDGGPSSTLANTRMKLFWWWKILLLERK